MSDQPQVPTTQDILLLAPICQYLALNDEGRGNIFRGGFIRKGLYRLIYIVRSSVQWLYDYSPSDSTLRKKAIYLYRLLSPYWSQAQVINNAGGTGVIVNPDNCVVSTVIAQDIQFTVGDVEALMVAGDNTLVLVYDHVLNASVGIDYNGQPLPTGVSTQKSYNVMYLPTQITITFNENVANTDLIIIRFLQYITI